MTEAELLEEISKKLSVLIALQLEGNEGETLQHKVMRLSRFGLTTSGIAEILGTTTGTVAVVKSRGKKRSQ